eukprot:scaffold174_cov98-Cylindrotheca_fusiformis.AAC.12
METFWACGEDTALTQMYSEEETFAAAPNKEVAKKTDEGAAMPKQHGALNAKEEGRQESDAHEETTSQRESIEKDRDSDEAVSSKTKKGVTAGKKFKFGLPSLMKRRKKSKNHESEV